MKSQRRLIFVAALMAAGVLACAPAGAQASWLLSGYGGPGQGSQALLGATLIGAGGGSSSGGSSGGSGGPSGPAALEVSASSAPRSAAGGSTRRSHPRHAASTAPSAGG